MKPCPILTALASLAHIDRPLYVACSGGRDSMALAYGCFLLYKQGKLSALPTLLHVHHGMQRANDEWAVFVADWAREHGFACQILPLNLNKKTETTARHARYHALATAMREDGVLLVAHHSDDQAETVLMRLINGAGVQGLSGMRVWWTRRVADRELTIHRPLLSVSREDITTFVHTHALAYVDDPTNDTTDNTRSFIRHEILPRLTALNPKTSQNIARTATLMDNAHALISETTFELFGACATFSGHTPFVSCLSVSKVQGLAEYEQLAVVRYFVQGGDPLPPNHQTVSDVLSLIARTDGDHQTRIFWQNDGVQDGQAYTFCRYQNTLYRYHHELFLLVQDEPCCDGVWLGDDEKILLKHNERFALFLYNHLGVQALFYGKSALIKPITRTDVLFIHQPYVDKGGHEQIGFIKLHGKKLYQFLKIPTWQRTNLWAIYVNDEPVIMMGMEQMWLTKSAMFDELMVALHGGRMGQTWLVVDLTEKV